MIAAPGMIVIIDSQTAGSPPDVPVCATSAFPDATVIVIAVQDPDQALQDFSLGAPDSPGSTPALGLDPLERDCQTVKSP